jgi:hypothetical protein
MLAFGRIAPRMENGHRRQGANLIGRGFAYLSQIRGHSHVVSQNANKNRYFIEMEQDRAW